MCVCVCVCVCVRACVRVCVMHCFWLNRFSSLSLSLSLSLSCSLSLSFPPVFFLHHHVLLFCRHRILLDSAAVPFPPAPHGSPQRSEVQMFGTRRPFGRRLSLCNFFFFSFHFCLSSFFLYQNATRAEIFFMYFFVLFFFVYRLLFVPEHHTGGDFLFCNSCFSK